MIRYLLSIINSSRHFHLIDNLGYYFLAGYVGCLCLVGQTNTMTQHVVSYGTHILRNHIAATLDEGLGTGCLGQVDAGTW